MDVVRQRDAGLGTRALCHFAARARRCSRDQGREARVPKCATRGNSGRGQGGKDGIRTEEYEETHASVDERFPCFGHGRLETIR